MMRIFVFFFFSSRRRHTSCSRDWSSDVCSSDLRQDHGPRDRLRAQPRPGAGRHRPAGSEAEEIPLNVKLLLIVLALPMAALAQDPDPWDATLLGVAVRARPAYDGSASRIV